MHEILTVQNKIAFVFRLRSMPFDRR